MARLDSFTIRIGKRDRALLERAARAAGADSLSDWARTLVLEAAGAGRCPCCGCTKATHRGVVVAFGNGRGK